MYNSSPIASDEVRFRSIFDTSPELILYQNEDSIILDANPAFLRLVQEPRERVVNRHYNEFLPPGVQPFYREKLQEAFTGKVIRFDMYGAQGNSAARHWDVVKVPVIEGERVVGVHMIARDVTEKVQSQTELLAQNNHLQQFTYIVSHNLRSPLSNAIGLSDLLSTEEPGTAAFEIARAYLQTSLHQLDQILEDMHTILALDHNEGLVHFEDVPLAEVVQQVVQNLQEVVNECGGTVRVSIPDGLRVRANRAYLYSIFFNLLSNAIKYRAAHRPLRVELSATAEGGRGKVITCSDNGSGIDLERVAAEDVFKLYKRFHPHHSGRGLGLYLVKNHLQSMGGRIEVSSRVDVGTSFLILLP